MLRICMKHRGEIMLVILILVLFGIACWFGPMEDVPTTEELILQELVEIRQQLTEEKP